MKMKSVFRTVFEIILIVIIIVQSYFIYMLYKTINSDFLPKVKGLVEDFACTDTLSVLLEFDKDENYEALFTYGNMLLEKGWDNDTFVLQYMAKAYYVKGDTVKAIELLNKAINGNYLCQIIKPSKKESLDLEMAMARYLLAELYQENGNQDKAKNEFEIAFNLAKSSFGEKYNEDVFLKLCNRASFKKLKRNERTEQLNTAESQGGADLPD